MGRLRPQPISTLQWWIGLCLLAVVGASLAGVLNEGKPAGATTVRSTSTPAVGKALYTSTPSPFNITISTTTQPTTTITARWQRLLEQERACKNEDMNCYFWVANSPEKCSSDENVMKICRRACLNCGEITLQDGDTRPFLEVPEQYDIRRIPENLHKVAFLVGRWQSNFGGKADFPTIPRFTYGERLDFSIIAQSNSTAVLNYTAFAWDNSDLTELHSENGFITGKHNSSWVSLNTVMNSGFVTIEEGEEWGQSISFRLRRIGRIHFSRDLPVRKMIREWTLLNATHLESRLTMGTLTHRMLLHTSIIYKRTYP